MCSSRRYNIILVFVFLLTSGCAVKSITKPRSEIIEDALDAGLEIRSIEVENALFFEREREHQERLQQLVQRRESGDYRDVNYRIGPGDELEINVFDVEELNVTARVRGSGYLSLPLIGALKAAGMTESEITDELSKRLATFVRKPQVSVFVSGYGSQKVAVVGAVQKPGTFPLKKGVNSLMELINEAGGLTERAGNYVNFVAAEAIEEADTADRAMASFGTLTQPTRSDNAVELPVDQVMGTTGGIPIDLPVRGGDMIIVPESGKVMVEGEVEKTGSFDLGRQMTLLGALAAAGGITYSAKVDEAEIVRDFGVDDKRHLVLDLRKIATGEQPDVRLRNGDLVRVPSDSNRRLGQDTFDGITRIINFGIGGSVNLAN